MTIDVEGDHVEADHVEGNDVEGDNVEETDNDGHGRCEDVAGEPKVELR